MGLLKLERITVNIPKSLKARLLREAEDRDRSLGKMAGIVIKEYFDQKDAPPPSRPAPVVLPPLPQPVTPIVPIPPPLSGPNPFSGNGRLPAMLPVGLDELEAA